MFTLKDWVSAASRQNQNMQGRPIFRPIEAMQKWCESLGFYEEDWSPLCSIYCLGEINLPLVYTTDLNPSTYVTSKNKWHPIYFGEVVEIDKFGLDVTVSEIQNRLINFSVRDIVPEKEENRHFSLPFGTLVHFVEHNEGGLVIQTDPRPPLDSRFFKNILRYSGVGV